LAPPPPRQAWLSAARGQVYLELTKPVFGGDGADGGTPAARAARAVLHHCLETGMRLLHPFMPFVTEELWQRLARSPGDPETIMVASYPQQDPALVDAAVEAETKVPHAAPSLLGK
jgi:valyl-tRNA synthetase